MNLNDRCAQYERATAELLELASRVDPADLDRHVEAGWSARQVVHHLADAETNAYVRLRRLLAEPPGTLIQGYDERAWSECATLGYTALPIESALAVFAAVRRASLDVLGRLEESDLARSGRHSESGHYTLEHWIDIYTRHPREHAAQLLEAINA